MKLVWRTRTNQNSIASSTTSSASPSTTASDVNLNEKNAHQSVTVTDAVAAATLAEKEGNTAPKQELAPTASKWGWSWRLSKKRPLKAKDVEKGTSGREDRPIRLFGPFYDGLGLGFAICERVFEMGSFFASQSHSLHLKWSGYPARRVPS